jgi:cellobiose phosphorylase
LRSRAEYDGLLIDPQLPDEWNEVKMTRSFRGATYDITINRTGSRLLTVDGKQYPANVAPVFDDQKVHKVEYTF